MSDTGSGNFVNGIKRFYYWVSVHCTLLKWWIFQIFLPSKKFSLQEDPSLKGKVVVLTGGSDSIAAPIIKYFLKLDAHLIIGSRSISTVEKVITSVREKGIYTGSNLTFHLDIENLESVRSFADKILKLDTPINILINNGGVIFVPFELTTKDGFETHFQANYLSHFLLTNLLLSRIVSSSTEKVASRIINISSVCHFSGNINFEDLQNKQNYSRFKAYADSKFYSITFSCYLERILGAGANVRVFSIHPGFIYTPEISKQFQWEGTWKNWFFRTILMSKEKGAEYIVRSAVSPELENNCQVFIVCGRFVRPNKKCLDFEIQQKLWNNSNWLVGIRETFLGFHVGEPEKTIVQIEHEESSS